MEIRPCLDLHLSFKVHKSEAHFLCLHVPCCPKALWHRDNYNGCITPLFISINSLKAVQKVRNNVIFRTHEHRNYWVWLATIFKNYFLFLKIEYNLSRTRGWCFPYQNNVTVIITSIYSNSPLVIFLTEESLFLNCKGHEYFSFSFDHVYFSFLEWFGIHTLIGTRAWWPKLKNE